MGLFGFGKKKEKKHRVETVESLQEEILAEEKSDMIQGVEDLSETTVKEVMIPRIDVDFISLGSTDEEVIAKIVKSGHSRFPVYSGSIDNVIGVLYVKDLIVKFSEHSELNLEKTIRKAYFVPESKRIDVLLREFKRRHVHIAIAIDEYGGMSGIVCMEDIIEEIVGDIQDEFDNERADIVSLSDNIWICDARTSLDDLNEEIHSNFPTEDFDTLGGFVFDLFGKIPVKFEKVNWKNYDFIVQEMEGHKVNVIKIICHDS
ncbi:HlyC/CorC family transporter [Treponema rectale]|uniref:CBS domain containing-hemolysin-like protein n=1 Tax=Treponema rectale TaxID=744512 RepID=A0A840SB28_9SPIR|nr:hemolysin family protein [Treponema rectale]MBB5217910.1 CBS domain containing-hemolysin-like protein [Treponema rectale]QOS40371.1 HlyC/CorC family transporter [Treponema rectale]